MAYLEAAADDDDERSTLVPAVLFATIIINIEATPTTNQLN
jgi:hypothetical protein